MGRIETSQLPSSSCSAPVQYKARCRSLGCLKIAGLLALTCTLSALVDLQGFVNFSQVETYAFPWPFGPKVTCSAPAPNLFAYHPPRPSNDRIQKASEDIAKYLADRVSKDDIDSIALSIVTPAGPIFEGGYGVLKANETGSDSAHRVDRDSIYRIASISKMFTVLETLILRERGVLNWDDPVRKYLPEFNPPSYGWAEYLSGLDSPSEQGPRITIRQLASHLSGLGRDYPPGDIGEWPIAARVEVAANETDTSYQNFMKSVSTIPLVNLPYEYPIYSNNGISLLGLANVAANKNHSTSPESEPQSHKELLQRDIFEPLGLRSSFYRVPDDESLRAHLAVPSKNSIWADYIMGDVIDAAGGQYSSLGDLAKLMQTLLSPTARGSLIPADVVREWLRPLHSWGSGGQEVGAPWEIMTVGDVKAYSKGGNLPGYHSEFVLIPEHAIGFVLLITGENADTFSLVKEVVKRFIDPVAKLHEEEVKKHYAGTWINGEDEAEVEMKDGALVLKKLRIRGIDVLSTFQTGPFGTGLTNKGPDPMGLWTTGRPGEFRIAIGRPASLNKVKDIGCMPYWISLDPSLFSRGAPIDLIYWKSGVLVYPSAGLSLSRKR